MLAVMPANISDAELRRRLQHVRWIGGGTGTGKSTVASLLAQRFGLGVYDGDQAARGYMTRVDPEKQPHYAAWLAMSPQQRWLERTPEEIFADMPTLHGESFPFVLDDLLSSASEQIILVDDFRTLPRHVAPLLSWPEQAVFLLPTPSFRERALRNRYSDPKRARANWGDADVGLVLAARLARDELWDAEVRRQADGLGLRVIAVDGTRSPDELSDQLAPMFRLGQPRSAQPRDRGNV
jgi:hypothetical protein